MNKFFKKFNDNGYDDYNNDDYNNGYDDNGYYHDIDDEGVVEPDDRDNSFESSYGESDTASAKTVRKNNSASIKLVKPHGITDGFAISDSIADGSIVVIDMAALSRGVSVRLLDFLAGATHALGAEMIRTNDTTIVIAPEGVDMSGFDTDGNESDDDDGDDNYNDNDSDDGAYTAGM